MNELFQKLEDRLRAIKDAPVRFELPGQTEQEVLQLAKDVLAYGALFEPTTVRLLSKHPGCEPSRCFDNIARLLLNSEITEMVFGWALDEIWRPHAWGLTDMDGGVVETTEPRSLYYGSIQGRMAAEAWVRDRR